MTPDEQCARILGREYLTHVQPKFGDAIPVRLEYGSDETLLGEMFDWFNDNGFDIQLIISLAGKASFAYIHRDDDEWSNWSDAEKANKAVRDALIQASKGGRMNSKSRSHVQG